VPIFAPASTIVRTALKTGDARVLLQKEYIGDDVNIRRAVSEVKGIGVTSQVQGRARFWKEVAQASIGHQQLERARYSEALNSHAGVIQPHGPDISTSLNALEGCLMKA
jgi:hypothetical protein